MGIDGPAVSEDPEGDLALLLSIPKPVAPDGHAASREVQPTALDAGRVPQGEEARIKLSGRVREFAAIREWVCDFPVESGPSVACFCQSQGLPVGRSRSFNVAHAIHRVPRRL